MFIPLQKIIPRTIEAFGLKRQADAAAACEKFRKIAPIAVHEKALENIYPQYLRGKTLCVGVANAAWAARVKESEAELLQLLNKALGEGAIEKIRTRIVVGVAPKNSEIPEFQDSSSPYGI
ncbi:DUF721 domain-containing protein [Candidatus Peregrinibacteria bacterium]|nr:DUF721 domain-containing protein [Candidatus Peregrinibacteria bacterium]